MTEHRTLQGAEELLRSVKEVVEEARDFSTGWTYVGKQGNEADDVEVHATNAMIAIDAFLALPSPDAGAGGEWRVEGMAPIGLAQVTYNGWTLLIDCGLDEAADFCRMANKRLNARAAAPAQAGLREALEGAVIALQEIAKEPPFRSPDLVAAYRKNIAETFLREHRAALADEQAKGEGCTCVEANDPECPLHGYGEDAALAPQEGAQGQ